MNIFFVSRVPYTAAMHLCDKHIVKMTLETTQILCSVLHRYGQDAPYKDTHKNHPCVRWAGDSLENCAWLCLHAESLYREYTYRYGKRHKCEDIFKEIKPALFEIEYDKRGFVYPPQCMPDMYKQEDTISAYRAYYQGEKARFAAWTKRPIPTWFKELEKCQLHVKVK